MFYTKYRPQKFAELFGLKKVVKVLTNQIARGEVGHAYLFAGPRGVGKTTTARLLAKAVNCSYPKEGEPCGKCDFCKAIGEGRFVDLLEIDAASNRGIDDIRNLREKVGLAPVTGRFKVYIIDEVHMLTREAFNALLKTLEEPPPHAIFVLCTTEPHKVPETIRSRCQRFDFKRASIRDLVRKLEFIAQKEGAKVKKEELEQIAKNAEGGFRDAETMLEQLIIGGATIEEILGLSPDLRASIADFVDYLLKVRTKEALLFVNRAFEGGADLEVLTKTILEYFRSLLLVKAGVDEELVEATEEITNRMKHQAEQITVQKLEFLINEFTHAAEYVGKTAIPQLALELAVMRVCHNEGEQKSLENEDGPDSLKGSRGDVRGASSNEVSDIITKWDLLLKKVKPYNHSLEALLRSCRPLKIEDGVLFIEAFYRFHKERLEELKNRRLLEKILTEFAGVPLKVRTLLGKKGTPGPSESGAAEKSPEKSPAGEDLDQLGREALEVFNGEL